MRYILKKNISNEMNKLLLQRLRIYLKSHDQIQRRESGGLVYKQSQPYCLIFVLLTNESINEELYAVCSNSIKGTTHDNEK